MPTVIIGNNTGDDYSGVEDNQIDTNNISTNHSTDMTFGIARIGTTRFFTLLRFTGLSSVPDGEVTAATLYMYLTSSGGGAYTIALRRLLRNWGNTTSTWNSYGGGDWTTSGALSDNNDRDDDISASTSVSTATGYKSFSGTQLTTDVEDIHAGTVSNNGWAAQVDTDVNNWMTFISSEGTDGRRPYLSVTYTESGGSSLPAIINNYRQQGVM